MERRLWSEERNKEDKTRIESYRSIVLAYLNSGHEPSGAVRYSKNGVDRNIDSDQSRQLQKVAGMRLST